MTNLTAKQESFIRLMTESDELARRGFDLLMKREHFETFFDALDDAGLFAPERNPAPVPVEPSGSFRLPYWAALDYLLAVAKVAGTEDDQALANKVMNVLRKVTRDSAERARDNYHTWRKFAEILELIPSRAVTLEDIGLVPSWLGSCFDRGMVGHALDKGALNRFVTSDSAPDWEKALELMRHCTAIRCDATHLGEAVDKPVTVVDDYWLKKLIKRHAAEIGTRVGSQAAKLFLERVREVFRSQDRRSYSYSYRPAVEDHAQNRRSRGPENRMVEGLRDVLLSWCDDHSDDVTSVVRELLHDEDEIVRRIGIYVLNSRWASLRDLYLPVVSSEFFQSGHLHELYGLLNQRFDDMSDAEKDATLAAIRGLPEPTWSDDPGRLLRRRQKRWLSAIVGKGYAAAEQWDQELASDPTVGVSEHPDFDVYMETTHGPGPTPYDVHELLTFAREGVLVEKLNAFVPTDIWRGPAMEGLVEALEEAVRSEPEFFLEILDQFLETKRRFQYAVIVGLKQAWGAPDKHPALAWDRCWDKILGFVERIIGSETFWTEEIDETQFGPNRDWIVSSVAEFLKAVVQSERYPYDSALMLRTLALTETLLENARSIDQPSDDAMFTAINSSRGKAVEALFSCLLKLRQVVNRETQTHAEAWAIARGLVEAELVKCRNANYEFSTLCGAHIGQLYYIDPEWLLAVITQIFPVEYAENTVCAVDGLGYATASRPIYALLLENGIIDRALRLDLRGQHARERLIERIAVAYLWADEELSDARFSFLFEAEGMEDLQSATHYFWSVSGEELSDDQRARILCFWERCIEWAETAAESPTALMSALSRLSVYLKSAAGREGDLLLAVAPHVAVDHNTQHFVEELVRFVAESPERVNAILGTLLQTHQPFSDYEGTLRSLLIQLANKGYREDVLRYAEQLRDLQGMQELFNRLTREPQV